jgi:hypothetical protein
LGCIVDNVRYNDLLHGLQWDPGSILNQCFTYRDRQGDMFPLKVDPYPAIRLHRMSTGKTDQHSMVSEI